MATKVLSNLQDKTVLWLLLLVCSGIWVLTRGPHHYVIVAVLFYQALVPLFKNFFLLLYHLKQFLYHTSHFPFSYVVPLIPSDSFFSYIYLPPAMAQQTPPKSSSSTQNFQLLSQVSLDIGSYGKVCKAILDQLPCKSCRFWHFPLWQPDLKLGGHVTLMWLAAVSSVNLVLDVAAQYFVGIFSDFLEKTKKKRKDLVKNLECGSGLAHCEYLAWVSRNVCGAAEVPEGQLWDPGQGTLDTCSFCIYRPHPFSC